MNNGRIMFGRYAADKHGKKPWMKLFKPSFAANKKKKNRRTWIGNIDVMIESCYLPSLFSTTTGKVES